MTNLFLGKKGMGKSGLSVMAIAVSLALAATLFYSGPASAGWTNCSLVIAGGATWTTTLTPASRERATNDKNISWYKNANQYNQMPGGEYGLSGWTYLGGGKTVDFTIYPQLFPVSGALYGMRVQLANSAYAMREDSDTIYVDLDNPTISTPTDAGTYSSSSSLTFYWTASDGTSGINDYYMIVGTQPGWSDKFSGWIGAQPGSYTINNCSDAYTYYCTMYAKDNAGRVSSWTASSNGIMVDLTNPTVYTPTDAGYYDDGNVTFNFYGLDGQSGIAGYYYEVAADPNFTYVLASGTTSSSSYTYTDTVQGVTYYCKTKAIDNAGRLSGYSSASDGVRVDSQAPSTPSKPASAVDHDYVTFYWNESSDPGYDTGAGVGVTGYKVQVQDDQSSYVVNADVMTKNFYKFKGSVGRSYTCTVQAFDGAGNRSSFSTTSDSAAVGMASTTPSNSSVTGGQTDWMFDVTTSSVTSNWPGLSEGQTGSIYDKVRNFTNLTETYSLRYGQIVDVWYTSTSRASVAKLEGCGDGAAWTASYLAFLANEWAVTGDPATLAKINSTLNVFDMLTRCTKKSGFMARFAAPTNDSAYYEYYNGYTGGAYQCEAPWQNYTYLGYTSRDPYTGLAFGLCSVWKYVSDTNTNAKAKMLIERVIDRLVNDNWDIVAPAPGNQTTYNQVAFGWKAMWKRLGLAVNPTKYADFDSGTESYANLYAAAMASSGFDLKAKDFADYFANYLNSEQLWVLINTDPNSTRKAELTAKLEDMADSDHFQAVFASMYMNATGVTSNNIALGTLQGGLLDFQGGDKWMREVDQTSNPDYPYHNAENTLSLTALLVHDRPLSDFLWQRKPGLLADGADGIAYEYPALDMMLPYWQARVVSALAPGGPDETAPVITILGANPARVGTANTYTDAGATAWDEYDGNLTSSIQVTNGVNNSVPGTYYVDYEVTDAANNTGTAQRTVNVISGSIPVISLTGDPLVLVARYSTYNDAGATASDAIDGNITSSIVTNNPVNTSVVGTYTVTYNVTNSSSNAADQVTRTVVVYSTGPVTGKRVLVVGDSWAQAVSDSDMIDKVCDDNGHGEFQGEGALTAIGGTTAEQWANNFNVAGTGLLDRLTAALNANPTIDIVYLSIGGNDMWDANNDGWVNGIDPTVWTQHKANIKANVDAVVDYCLAYNSAIKVVIAGYDYLNLWDTIWQDPVDLVMWQALGSPSPAQINGAFADAAVEIRQIALDNPTRVKYVQGFGLMQWWKNTPSGAAHPGTIANSYSPWPGGNSAYPTPMSTLGGTSSNRDAIHLSTAPANWYDPATECGYGKLVQNVYDQVLGNWLLN